MVDKRIAEDKIEIMRLEAEKEGLKTAFEACNEQYNQLQQKVCLLEGIAQNYGATIDMLKSKQAEEENQRNHSHLNSLNLKYVVILVAILTIGMALAYIKLTT